MLSIAVRVQCFRVLALLGLALTCPPHPPCPPGCPRHPDPPLPRRRPSSPRIHCPPRHHRRPHPPRLVPPPRPPRHHRPPRNPRPSHLLRIMCQSPCPNQQASHTRHNPLDRVLSSRHTAPGTKHQAQRIAPSLPIQPHEWQSRHTTLSSSIMLNVPLPAPPLFLHLHLHSLAPDQDGLKLFKRARRDSNDA